jgi:hypothetical protein
MIGPINGKDELECREIDLKNHPLDNLDSVAGCSITRKYKVIRYRLRGKGLLKKVICLCSCNAKTAETLVLSSFAFGRS